MNKKEMGEDHRTMQFSNNILNPLKLYKGIPTQRCTLGGGQVWVGMGNVGGVRGNGRVMGGACETSYDVFGLFDVLWGGVRDL